MNTLTLLFVSASLLFSFHLNGQEPATQVKSFGQPYKLQYNNIIIGNPVYAQKIIKGWKDYDNNKMDALTSIMTDNAVAYFPNGTVAKGADKINQVFKSVRNSFTSINSDVYACTTLKSPDYSGYEFAVIWGVATYSKKDGSIHKTGIHKVSRFNNEGKVDATQTDYSVFKKRGGKMIMYHGWSDPGQSAFTTIQHYEQVEQNDKNIQSYIRLFLLPGVLHCGGGSGPDQVDWLALVRDWVENNKAPERILASKIENGKVVMSRPVFPYPQVAAYTGKGDTNDEKNFIKKKK